MERKLLLWTLHFFLFHYGEGKGAAINFYDSSEKNFAQLRAEITGHSVRRKRKRSLATRSDKELIVEKDGRRHLLLLKQIRVIDEENYELRIPHDYEVDELFPAPQDALEHHIVAENCTYFGRTYHDRYSSAFVNICDQTGFIEDRRHGRINLDSILEDAREKVNGASCGDKSEAIEEPRDFRSSRHFARQTRAFHSRKKRYIVPRELRVAVFVDPSMTRFFRQLGSSVISIENYLAKIMSIVAGIIRHPSLGQDITLKVVRTEIMPYRSDNPFYYNAETVDADHLLSKFCRWQSDQNYHDPRDKKHWDTSVLITKKNLCSLNDPSCNTLGLAEKYKICSPSKSCAIIEDTGMATAYTITHEIGHLLGAIHDDHPRCQAIAKEEGIMGSVFLFPSETMIGPWSWSKCSSQKIGELINQGLGNCMMRRTREFSVRSPTLIQPHTLIYTGRTHISPDVQCKLVFGHASMSCQRGPSCSKLWCKTRARDGSELCATRHQPWADGTACAAGKACYHKQCVSLSQANPHLPFDESIDGGWSQWSNWSPCSSTCKGGITSSNRLCNNPIPQNGGAECSGTSSKHRFCNSDRSCPPLSADPRDTLCKKYQKKDALKAQWMDSSDRVCNLFCVDPARSWLISNKGPVPDGSLCRTDRSSICIKGECHELGCDGNIDSLAKEDTCGVCKGDDSTCKTFRKRFYPRGRGYVRVAEIPKSRNVVIKQLNSHASDEVYLVLKQHGVTIFNGRDFRNKESTVIWEESSGRPLVIEYSGYGARMNEQIKVNHLMSDGLEVYVFKSSKQRYASLEINYSYSSLSEQKLSRETFEWQYSGWSGCSSPCGGYRERILTCRSRSSGATVSSARCSQTSLRSKETEKCDSTKCKLEWRSVLGECSSTCGQGTAKQSNYCIKVSLSDSSIERMANSICEEERIPAPPENIPCYQDCSNAKWELGSWTGCSTSCGRGVRSRLAICRSSTGVVIDEKHCGKISEPIVEVCHIENCAEWAKEDWSSCSVTCGTGLQSRAIICKRSGEKVHNSYCDRENMPTMYQQCEMSECNSWNFGEWSTCSATCGEGSQSRSARCLTSNCPTLERDTVQRSCNTDRCPNESEWVLEQWTTCSNSCGSGTKRRVAKCVKRETDLASRDCPPEYRPRDIEEACFSLAGCQREVLPKPKWEVTSDWTSCSTTCGQGVKTRQVECILNGERERNRSKCDDSTKPVTTASCELISCRYLWKYSKWTECSATCNKGVRSRKIHCERNDGHVVDDIYCRHVPVLEEEAQLEDCWLKTCPQYEWRAGRWARCDAKCGSGKQSRKVFCFRNGDKRVHSRYCMKTYSRAAKPDKTKRCRAERFCTRWRSTEWSLCDNTCHQGREVFCQERHTKIKLPNDKCNEIEKPKQKRGCRKNCSRGIWKVSNWRSCSGTCQSENDAMPTKSRRVDCISPSNGAKVHRNACAKKSAPLSRRACSSLPSCKSIANDWKVGEWGPCTQKCGGGVQTRRVECPRGRVCSKTKPRTSVKCNQQRCTAMHCRDVQRLNSTSTDGEYLIEIDGKLISIFCFAMSSSNPQEYITLREKENFSFVYRHQLADNSTCPVEGVAPRLATEAKIKGGKTLFHKLRFFPETLEVATSDVAFSTSKGTPVKFAQAGDCFSSSNCPQGSFSINLAGTGFTVEKGQNWLVKGNHGTMKMWRAPDGTRLQARCGGLCAQCIPEKRNRIKLALLID